MKSSWHQSWQDAAKARGNAVEVTFDGHRADIVTRFGLIIELQTSSITPETIREHEEFYGNLIWIFEANPKSLDVRPRDGYVTFRWKNPGNAMWYPTKPVYLDLGDEVLRVKKVYREIPCGGWGSVEAKGSLMGRIFGSNNTLGLEKWIG